MIVWTYNSIGRNIVIFINSEYKKIGLEYNAWVDLSDIRYKKIVIVRRWTNNKFHMFYMPKNFKITKEFKHDYDNKLNVSLKRVNDLAFKDLDKKIVLSI